MLLLRPRKGFYENQSIPVPIQRFVVDIHKHDTSGPNFCKHDNDWTRYAVLSTRRNTHIVDLVSDTMDNLNEWMAALLGSDDGT